MLTKKGETKSQNLRSLIKKESGAMYVGVLTPGPPRERSLDIDRQKRSHQTNMDRHDMNRHDMDRYDID